MPCLDCDKYSDKIYVHEAQEPFCEQCGATNTCVEVIDAKCVVYHSDNLQPSRLQKLGMPNGASAERIFEAIDDLIGSGFNKPIVPLASQSVLLTVSGPVGHDLRADVILSPAPGNILQIRSDGIYATNYNDGKVKVDATDQADFLENQIVGGTDGIVSVSVIKQDGQLVLQPSLDIEALLLAIKNSPFYTSLVCQIVAGCVCNAPLNVTAKMI